MIISAKNKIKFSCQTFQFQFQIRSTFQSIPFELKLKIHCKINELSVRSKIQIHDQMVFESNIYISSNVWSTLVFQNDMHK